MSVKGFPGRDIEIRDSTDTLVAGLNSKSVEIAREEINVTSDDEDGVQTLLGEAGNVAVNISGDGFVKTDPDNTDFVDEALEPDTVLKEYTLRFPWGKDLTSDFFLGTFNITGNTNEGVTFSISLMSAGPYTFTDSPS